MTDYYFTDTEEQREFRRHLTVCRECQQADSIREMCEDGQELLQEMNESLGLDSA